ncbi:uncharacterized protein LOC134705109 [Mytilus trossulus]|uniref:uncharacterized protein LOC134705109 n=1 Tax=Mytilus trossulus TaxID=6551 RepID=UPI0030068686
MISVGLFLFINVMVSLQLADGHSENKKMVENIKDGRHSRLIQVLLSRLTCPENAYWDSDTEQCENNERVRKQILQTSASCPPNENCQCGEGYFYDPIKGMCIPESGCCNGNVPG